MAMTTNRVNEANATAEGQIPKLALDEKINSLATKYAKTIKMHGFRPGKVPISLVKKEYKDKLESEAKQELLNKFYDEALKELKVDVKDALGQPAVTKFEEKPEGIDVSLKIGLYPTFNLDKLDECVPSFEAPVISDEAVEERLSNLAKAQANLVESKKDTLENGLIADISFKGFIDGKEFEGGSAENFALEIDSKQFIPGFEEALVGMKVGKTKDVNITFPSDYAAEHLANKPVTFKVTLNAIKEREQVAIDDALAKKILGEESNLAELKEKTKEELFREAKQKLYNDDLKQEVLKNMSEKFSFDLPENIIEQEMNVLFNSDVRSLSKEEVDALSNDQEKVKEKFESFREAATLSVKVTFIIDKIAREKKVVVKDDEVMQAVYYEALVSQQNPQEVLNYYKENNLFPAVKMAMIEDKIITNLLDSKLDKK
ncbi:trigger factor [Helicobacter sp. 13S00401-1]|nr:trigger factor [Helicobacter sp. 13S00401-1]